MKISSWLIEATKTLQGAGIDTAYLDASVLLGDILHHDKSWLLAHPEYELEARQVEQLTTQIKQRVTHTPLAYIRGTAEFYGREFIVMPDVLVPRPESEIIIDQLKQLDLPGHPAIADIGTGSGALAITAKLEISSSEVLAIDIMPECLVVAQENAKRHDATVQCIHSNLLENISQHIDVIVANLPYVPDDYQLNTAATKEPTVALFGGPDGLNMYRTLFAHISKIDQKPLHIITESLPFQHSELSAIAEQNGYVHLSIQGLAQVFRAN